jgi:hypothetical protein
MPGIRYVRAAADGGPLKGGAPRVVWHVLEADPHQVSARSAAQRLDQAGDPGHLVWNPHNGEIIQLIPIVRAGRSLGPAGGRRAARWSEPDAGDGNVNAEGRVCVQICVVARADEPFTDGPMVGRREILAWLDTWDISRSWPAGPPAPSPDCHAAVRSRRLWARGGHFGASQVPGLTATGPGAIDPERLTGRVPAKGGHLAAVAAAARGDGPLHGAPVPAAVPAAAVGQPPGAGYDPPDLGELLGTRSASLSRVH